MQVTRRANITAEILCLRIATKRQNYQKLIEPVISWYFRCH